MPEAVIYPSQIKKDKDKLFACYSLVQQMIDEYNRQSTLASANKEAYSDKFRRYTKEQFDPRLKQLLAERNRLIEKIRWDNYTPEEWKQISKLSQEEQNTVYQSLFGDKTTDGAKPTLATSPALDELKAIDFTKLSPLEGADPTEDFTTYTEVDEGSEITKDSNTITFTDFDSRLWTSYVYKDKGVNHFDGDFEHREKVYLSTAINAAWLLPWLMANAIGDEGSLTTANENYLAVRFYDTSPTDDLYLIERDGASAYSDIFAGYSHTTLYYLTIKRDEAVGTYGTIYLYVCTGNYYGESGSSTVDILSVTLHTSKKDFRYIYGLAGWDAALAGKYISGYVEDLDLQEGVTHEASATLSGVGTLTAIGRRIVKGAATLAGTGTLAGIGQGIFTGKASLDGQGTLVAVGRRIVSGVATLSGTGTLAAIGQRLVYGVATLSGTGTLAGIGHVSRLFEYYNTGDDGFAASWGASWKAQTFTPSASHKIKSVKLKLYRVGSPGTLTVSIRATDGNGHPTGGDLCSGSIDGDSLTTNTAGAWYEITLGNGYDLIASTKYAIVVRATGGSAGNDVRWRLDESGSYGGGNYEYSGDSGSNWSSNSIRDYMFEEWGEPVEGLVEGRATLSGEGSLAGTAHLIAIGQATLTGTGSLAGIGRRLCYGVATLSGEGSLAAIGRREAYGLATLSGTGTLAASGVGILGGKATLTGSGSLSGNAVLIVISTATLSGVGSLSAAGYVAGIQYGSATLSGEGTLSAAAVGLFVGASTLEGVGTLAAVGRRLTYGVATLSGQGTLVCASVLTVIVAATFSGTGALTAAGESGKLGSATLSGTGSLVAAAVCILVGQATLAGTGLLTAAGTTITVGELFTMTLYTQPYHDVEILTKTYHDVRIWTGE